MQKTAAVLFWILLWQGASMVWRDSLVFTGPLGMLGALREQIVTADFWHAVVNSMVKIIGGFLSAFLLAIILACAAFRRHFLRILLEPLVLLQRAVPLASFVVLLLICIGSANLSVSVVFLMAFPVLYGNVIEGFSCVPKEMREMAKVYRMPLWNQALYIYRPALFPFLMSGCKTALGLSWKAGVAAEIIGVPAHSIGEGLYLSKIYLNTDSLFAWTFVIILLSTLTEKIFLLVLKKLGGKAAEGTHDLSGTL